MKVQIDTVACFIDAYGVALPQPNTSFGQCFHDLDACARNRHGNGITGDALKNAHGTWFEWLLAICSWNARSVSGKTGVAVTLPNISAFDCADLYEPALQAMIQHLRNEVAAHGVQLITSNPDFVLMELGNAVLPKLPATIVNVPNPQLIHSLDSLYMPFVGQCSFDNLVGYIAAKASFRPDRRLQVAHEGSLMKALYKHLQTRLWITQPKGLHYYAMVIQATAADLQALKTVATHTIPDVSSQPQRAVDDILLVPTIQDAVTQFSLILPP